MNQAVKRNIERFPQRFMFQLTSWEYNSLRSQSVTIKSRGSHRKYLPYAFTEQGIAMLSGVLRSKTAIQVSIRVIDAFVEMRKFIANNTQIFYRLENIDKKLLDHDNKIDQVFKAIEDKSIKPSKGIFFDGQVFDAYKFISDLIRSAKNSIILIDNYIDESVLAMFGKRSRDVEVKIYTKVSKILKQDISKFNSQYPEIKLKDFNRSHNRFILIDNDVYHIGASLKDLGRKWFAFSKFDKSAMQIIEKLECI